MNDYLWDKTGEPDAETKRLEDLLGTLRHQPRPLELPKDLTINPRRRALWPTYAVAAALLLTALAGFWFGLVRRREQSATPPSMASSAHQPGTPKAAQPMTEAAAIEPDRTPEKRVEQDEVAHAETERKINRHTLRHAPATSTTARDRQSAERQATRAGQLNVARVRRQPQPQPFDAPRRVRPELESVALAREQQSAKEQLMLALRVTSAKLSVVQRKTQGTTPQGTDAKPVPDEQNKIR